MIDQDLKNLNEPLVKNGNTHSYLDNGSWLDELGDSHQTTSIETPVNTENLNKSDAEKLTKIQYHFKEIMETQGKQKEEITLNKLFRHRLYRPSTRLVAGRHIKDVSCLGTDMKRTLLIDNDANAMLATPDNAILVHDYLGGENDKLFEDLLPMLAYLSTQEDIRPELIKHFRIREELTRSHFKIVEPAVSSEAEIKK